MSLRPQFMKPGINQRSHRSLFQFALNYPCELCGRFLCASFIRKLLQPGQCRDRNWSHVFFPSGDGLHRASDAVGECLAAFVQVFAPLFKYGSRFIHTDNIITREVIV